MVGFGFAAGSGLGGGLDGTTAFSFSSTFLTTTMVFDDSSGFFNSIYFFSID